MSRRRIEIGVLALSTLVAIGAAEIAVRMFADVRSVGPSFFIYDPVYRKSLRQDFTGLRITPEFSMEFTTNSLGFRGPELGEESSGGIVFLGDSFTMGYGVDDGEEFPILVGQRLAKALDKDTMPVINMGIYNSGNGRWIKQLEREVGQFDPELVVLQFSKNDFRDNVKDRFYALEGDVLRELPVEVEARRQKIQTRLEEIPVWSYSHLVSLVRQVWADRRAAARNRANPQAGDARPSPNEPLTYAIVDRVLEMCSDEQWPVLGMTVYIEDEQRQELFSRFQARGFPFVSIPSKRKRPDLYYEIDGHWTATGHSEVADLLVRQILADVELFSEAR